MQVAQEDRWPGSSGAFSHLPGPVSSAIACFPYSDSGKDGLKKTSEKKSPLVVLTASRECLLQVEFLTKSGRECFLRFFVYFCSAWRPSLSCPKWASASSKLFTVKNQLPDSAWRSVTRRIIGDERELTIHMGAAGAASEPGTVQSPRVTPRCARGPGRAAVARTGTRQW